MAFEDNMIPVAGFSLTYENSKYTKAHIEKEVNLRGRTVKFIARDIEMPEGISERVRDNLEDIYFKKINELIRAYHENASKVIIGKEGITLIFSGKAQQTHTRELSWKEVESLAKNGQDIDYQEFQKLAIAFAKSYTPEGKAALTKQARAVRVEEFALFHLSPMDMESALTQLIQGKKGLKEIEKTFKEAMARRDISLDEKLKYLVHFKIALSVAKGKLSLPDRELQVAEKTVRDQWHALLKSANKLEKEALKENIALLEQFVSPRKVRLFGPSDEKPSEIERDLLELKKIFLKKEETLTGAIGNFLRKEEIVNEKNHLFVSLLDQFSKNFAVIREVFKENLDSSLASQMLRGRLDDEQASHQAILKDILTVPDFTVIMQNALKSVQGEDTLQAYLLLDAMDKQDEANTCLYMHHLVEAIKDPAGLNLGSRVKKALTDILLCKPDLVGSSRVYREIQGLLHKWHKVSEELQRSYIDSHYLEIVSFCNRPKHFKEALDLLHQLQKDHPERFSSLFRNIDRSIAIAYLKKHHDELLKNPLLFSPRHTAAYVENLAKDHSKRLPALLASLIDQSPAFIKFLSEEMAEKFMQNVIERIFTNLKIDEDYTPKIALYAQHFPHAVAAKFLKEYLLPEYVFRHLDIIPLTIVKRYIQEYPNFLTTANQELIVKYLDKQLTGELAPEIKAQLLVDTSSLIPEKSKWQLLRKRDAQEISDILLSNKQLLIDFLQLLYHSHAHSDVNYRSELVKACLKKDPSFIRQLPDHLVHEMGQPIVDIVFDFTGTDNFDDHQFGQLMEYTQYFPQEALAVKFLETFMIPDVVVENIEHLSLRIASLYLKAHSNGVTKGTQKHLADYLNRQSNEALKTEGKDFPLDVAQQLLEAGLLAGEAKEHFKGQLPVKMEKASKADTPQVTRKKVPSSTTKQEHLQKVEARTADSKKIREIKHKIDTLEKLLFERTPRPKNWEERMLNLAKFPITTQEPLVIRSILRVSKRNEETMINESWNAYALASDLMRSYRELRRLT